ncbi:26S proteasome non-ATPase regulatory subunit 11-like protein [Psilocybe cubensis]|uniref:26S proteasome non-ATPase regulatory subunit 11-like protein n=1 Tax=Psilocybe cubensis TaxID=181762 RepID=A0ACB8HFJ7_PSICU|nr:26S proteasome non-ATPase regulatory subunit 11-like protein [Psilocybe cubensis]KAH9485944.1 26S proteasome non-ATPase regulatory subunit 11-like protein [Psilocybe cubensis]
MGFDLRFGRPVNIEQRGLVTESLSTPTQRIDFPRAADLPNLYIECLNTLAQRIDFPRAVHLLFYSSDAMYQFPANCHLPNLYIKICLNARTQCIDFPRGDLLEDIKGELTLLTELSLSPSFPHPPSDAHTHTHRHISVSLTSFSTAASSIYGPPYLQSQTDMQSCILHAKGKDYSTVSSSFFEAFKNLSAAGMKDSSAAGGKVQDKEEKARAKEVGGDTKNEQG